MSECACNAVSLHSVLQLILLTCRSGHQLASVYLADGGGALLVVKVWNGLKVRMEAIGREGETMSCYLRGYFR